MLYPDGLQVQLFDASVQADLLAMTMPVPVASVATQAL
jgi:hypothetical protein